MHLKDGEEEYKGDYRQLSDDYRIGLETWATMKEAAMKDDYQQQAWFQALSEAEKE